MPRPHRSPANCIDPGEFRELLVPLPGRKDRLEIALAKRAELTRVRRHFDEVGLAAVIDEDKLSRVLRSLVIDNQRRRTSHGGSLDWAKVASDGKFTAPDEWLRARTGLTPLTVAALPLAQPFGSLTEMTPSDEVTGPRVPIARRPVRTRPITTIAIAARTPPPIKSHDNPLMPELGEASPRPFPSAEGE